ncbi:hypothetical protein Pcinc_020449 [Petrolisthes cinctipes]|uniref:Uncharacterized protein n=1 Tax=Petrolisthes cinctipes TaxID=88211 RepID=A0AAE1KLD4_PETCI|nr:hypothetical protein Pcinc_020449 [Petrolisthes cinctipes]
MRTRSNPGPDMDDEGLTTVTPHRNGSESTTSNKEKVTVTNSGKTDNSIYQEKTSIAIASDFDTAEHETSVADTSQVDEDRDKHSSLASNLSPDENDDDTDAWTLVKSKKKGERKENEKEQESLGQVNSATTSSTTKLLITPTEHFATSYDVVEALEEEHPNLKFHLKITTARNILVTPADTNTLHHIKNITELRGKPINFRTPETPPIQAILLHYPVTLPLRPILRHPKVADAERCNHTLSGTPTRQVLITITETNFPTLQASTKMTNKQATSHQPKKNVQEAAKPNAEMTYSQAASRASIPVVLNLG